MQDVNYMFQKKKHTNIKDSIIAVKHTLNINSKRYFGQQDKLSNKFCTQTDPAKHLPTVINSYGFNLIECIITLMIISILCVCIQPNYVSLWQKHSTLTSIKMLQQSLQYARTLAITRHTKISITPIQGKNWSLGIAIKNNEQVLKTIRLSTNTRLSWNGFGVPQDKILIYPNGMTYNNGHFTITYKDKIDLTYNLIVSKTLTTRVVVK